MHAVRRSPTRSASAPGGGARFEPRAGNLRAFAFGLAVLAMAFAAPAVAADFGTPGGSGPANLGEIASVLRSDPYELELLISFGTSKGGSAGHLALAIRDAAPGDDLVWSANFYADRSPEHATGRYTSDLMIAVPKWEYLYGTSSSLGPAASFGLDYGEVYKRSVVGIRVYGVPAAEKRALAAFFARINDDYRARAKKTEYHDEEIRYDYFHLNCAKTIGSAFKFGAGYRDLKISDSALSSRRKLVSALNANIPTEMAVRLMNEWNARGYAMDVVFYRKYPGSAYVDPHEEEKVAFKDLPDRFPSVLSRDFRREQGQYEDYDNLYAMYLLYNLGRYKIAVDGSGRRLEIAIDKEALPYREAAARAAGSAAADSESYRRRLVFKPRGTRIGESPAAR